MIIWSVQSIFGANVGFEFIPREVFTEAGRDDCNWALMLNCLFFRIMISDYIGDELDE